MNGEGRGNGEKDKSPRVHSCVENNSCGLGLQMLSEKQHLGKEKEIINPNRDFITS